LVFFGTGKSVHNGYHADWRGELCAELAEMLESLLACLLSHLVLPTTSDYAMAIGNENLII